MAYTPLLVRHEPWISSYIDLQAHVHQWQVLDTLPIYSPISAQIGVLMSLEPMAHMLL